MKLDERVWDLNKRKPSKTLAETAQASFSEPEEGMYNITIENYIYAKV